MRYGTFACVIALWFWITAFGDDAARPFSGVWTTTAQPANEGATTWVFGRQSDSLRVAEMRGANKLAEFECNTMGRDCEIIDGGKKATVSMWFNGPALVELETRGSDVVKRRFSTDEKGDAMDVEIIPISERGKPETLHFKRVEVAAHNQ